MYARYKGNTVRGTVLENYDHNDTAGFNRDHRVSTVSFIHSVGYTLLRSHSHILTVDAGGLLRYIVLVG